MVFFSGIILLSWLFWEIIRRQPHKKRRSDGQDSLAKPMQRELAAAIRLVVQPIFTNEATSALLQSTFPPVLPPPPDMIPIFRMSGICSIASEASGFINLFQVFPPR